MKGEGGRWKNVCRIISEIFVKFVKDIKSSAILVMRKHKNVLVLNLKLFARYWLV